jgi:hypothetical protein
MSGGSYNYLFTRVRSLGEQRSDLERMALNLEALPWAAQAAAATRQCLTLIDEAERLADTLSDVWHAIEWWDSCDWGEQDARPKVEAYTPPNGQRAEDVLYRLVDVGDGVKELRAVRGG